MTSTIDTNMLNSISDPNIPSKTEGTKDSLNNINTNEGK
jgi:hypothetical protein